MNNINKLNNTFTKQTELSRLQNQLKYESHKLNHLLHTRLVDSILAEQFKVNVFKSLTTKYKISVNSYKKIPTFDPHHYGLSLKRFTNRVKNHARYLCKNTRGESPFKRKIIPKVFPSTIQAIAYMRAVTGFNKDGMSTRFGYGRIRRFSRKPYFNRYAMPFPKDWKLMLKLGEDRRKGIVSSPSSYKKSSKKPFKSYKPKALLSKTSVPKN